MDVDLPEVHARALDATARLVAGVRGDQWGIESVCDGWTVRELVNHIVTGNWWVPELMGGQHDRGGRRPARWRRAGRRSQCRVRGIGHGGGGRVPRAPDAMDAPSLVSYGPVPGSIYAGHRFMDVLVHGWDVAMSTGQDTTLDPELVDACWVVVEPQLELLVGTGVFGTGSRDPRGRVPPQHAPARRTRPPRLDARSLRPVWVRRSL